MPNASTLSKACTAALAAGIVVTALSPAGIPAIIGAAGIAGYDLAKNLVAGFLQRRTETRRATPSELLHNGHLLRLIADSLTTCIAELRDFAKENQHGLLFADSRKWSDLADKIGPYWIENADDFHDTSFDQLGKDRIASALRDYMQNSSATTAATEDDWRKLLTDLATAVSLKLDDYILHRAAEHIHKKLPAVIYERTKESAALDPATFAGITLRFQTAILAEITKLPHTITQPILDEIRAVAKTQADFIAELRAKDGALAAIPDFRQLVTDFSALIPRLAERDQQHADEYKAIGGKLDSIIAQLDLIHADISRILQYLREQLPALISSGAPKLTFTPPRKLPPQALELFGREPDLLKCIAHLEKKNLLAVTGPGGLGKTALCAELIQRIEASPTLRQRAVGGIYIHDFYRQDTLGGFVSSIITQAGLPLDNVALGPALAAMALRQPGTLLYIEGGEKLADLEALLDFIGEHTTLIFTTRYPGQLLQSAGKTRDFAKFPIAPLATADAAAAIHRYAAQTAQDFTDSPLELPATDPGWHQLADYLGGHPLACTIAGSISGSESIPPSTLHAELIEKGSIHLQIGRDSRTNLQTLFIRTAEKLTPAALTAWSALTFGGTSHTPLAILRAIGVTDTADLTSLIRYGIARSKMAMSPEDGKTEAAYALAHALLAEWGRRELDKVEGASRPLSHQSDNPPQVVPAASNQGRETPPLLSVPPAEGGETPIADQPGGLTDSSRGSSEARAKTPGLPGSPMHPGRGAGEPGAVTEQPALHHPIRGESPSDHDRGYRSSLAQPPATLPQPSGLQPRPTHAEVVAEARKWALDYWDKFLEHPEVHCRPEQYRHTAPVAEGILREVEPLTKLGATNAQVFYYLPARMHQHHGQFALAEPIYRRCVERMKADAGETSAEYTTAISNLAALLQATNRLMEAEQLKRKVLSIRKRIHGPADPEVAIALNNLALLLQMTDRFAEAEPLMHEALVIIKVRCGEWHHEVAVQLNNLAQLLQDTNRLGEAEPLMRRALEIDEASFGPLHPNVAIRLNNLASLLQSTNRLSEAEPLVRRALVVSETNYGLSHPQVATSLSNLASLLHATNRLREAEPLMRRALAIDEACHGPTHPNVAVRLNNLATLLQDTRRSDEAEPLMRRALEIFKASYGNRHQQVAFSLNNLARLLQASNRMNEAEALLLEAIVIDENCFGLLHPNVAVGLNNLATVYSSTKRPDKAEPLLRRALTIDEKSFGPTHPLVGIRLNNLAQLLQDTNRLIEAEQMMERMVGIFLQFTAQIGHEHPHLRAVLINYALLCKEMQVPEEEFWQRMIKMFLNNQLSEKKMQIILESTFRTE